MSCCGEGRVRRGEEEVAQWTVMSERLHHVQPISRNPFWKHFIHTSFSLVKFIFEPLWSKVGSNGADLLKGLLAVLCLDWCAKTFSMRLIEMKEERRFIAPSSTWQPCQSKRGLHTVSRPGCNAYLALSSRLISENRQQRRLNHLCQEWEEYIGFEYFLLNIIYVKYRS